MENDSFREIIIAAYLHNTAKLAQYAGLPLQYGSEVFKQHFPAEVDAEAVLNLLAGWQQPQTPEDWIIHMASRLAGGFSAQTPLESGSSASADGGLQCLFDHIQFRGLPEPGRHFYTPAILQPEHLIPQPVAASSFPSVTAAAYKNHYSGFLEDYRQLKQKDFYAWLVALDTILKQYCWCIPANTGVSGHSLYDQLVITAAVSAAMYRYHQAGDSLDNIDALSSPAASKYLLVSGDLSGIQRYIFDLKNAEYSAKLLRARSFELQVLTDLYSSYILEMNRLPLCNRIMNAGGRFLLLLPNNRDTRATITRLRCEIEAFFLENYFGEITLNISSGVEASGDDFSQAKIMLLFDSITRDVNLARQKQLQSVLNPQTHIADHEYLKISSAADVCPACGKRARSKDEHCFQCGQLITLGKNIPKVNYLAAGDAEIAPGNDVIRFSTGGKQLFFARGLAGLPPSLQATCINQYQPGLPAVNFPFYLPVTEEGQVKTFEQLAACATGIPKIAMLKADMDNLGAVFSLGLGAAVSLGRYVALSRLLEYFFAACLNHEIKSIPGYRDIYTVFSGGDDLCLIGPWTTIIDFAFHINDLFRGFTGNNPSLTLSAGIVLGAEKTTVGSLAGQANKALDNAKEQKNQIHLFGCSMDWDTMQGCIETGRELYQKLIDEKLTSGLVYRLLDYGHRAERFFAGDLQSLNALWRSHFRYDVARNVKETADQSWLKSMVEANIQYIKVIASFALYKARKAKEQE